MSYSLGQGGDFRLQPVQFVGAGLSLLELLYGLDHVDVVQEHLATDGPVLDAGAVLRAAQLQQKPLQVVKVL